MNIQDFFIHEIMNTLSGQIVKSRYGCINFNYFKILRQNQCFRNIDSSLRHKL